MCTLLVSLPCTRSGSWRRRALRYQRWPRRRRQPWRQCAAGWTRGSANFIQWLAWACVVAQPQPRLEAQRRRGQFLLLVSWRREGLGPRDRPAVRCGLAVAARRRGGGWQVLAWEARSPTRRWPRPRGGRHRAVRPRPLPRWAMAGSGQQVDGLFGVPQMHGHVRRCCWCCYRSISPSGGGQE